VSRVDVGKGRTKSDMSPTRTETARTRRGRHPGMNDNALRSTGRDPGARPAPCSEGKSVRAGTRAQQAPEFHSGALILRSDRKLVKLDQVLPTLQAPVRTDSRSSQEFGDARQVGVGPRGSRSPSAPPVRLRSTRRFNQELIAPPPAAGDRLGSSAKLDTVVRHSHTRRPSPGPRHQLRHGHGRLRRQQAQSLTAGDRRAQKVLAVGAASPGRNQTTGPARLRRGRCRGTRAANGALTTPIRGAGKAQLVSRRTSCAGSQRPGSPPSPTSPAPPRTIQFSERRAPVVLLNTCSFPGRRRTFPVGQQPGRARLQGGTA